jgi:hypothetical protein
VGKKIQLFDKSVLQNLTEEEREQLANEVLAQVKKSPEIRKVVDKFDKLKGKAIESQAAKNPE